MIFEFSKLLFFIITSVYAYVTIILHTRKHYGGTDGNVINPAN
ncbi:hypothetical protein DF16_orf03311 [Bacillus thuringiensis serovar kurstaki str. YBT-1520]|nr:hypothetical protein HD73_2930 [Bacillus thuringiensis serovar kurstaki str. HD73]AIM31726.1 hypothetical protein DF16_orf03311 [Bacillus thuringiensis serovar kurstaki str. YBT-1520]